MALRARAKSKRVNIRNTVSCSYRWEILINLPVNSSWKLSCCVAHITKIKENSLTSQIPALKITPNIIPFTSTT